ncbi:MAG: ATP-binding cassette domain-containing protein [Gemmatimonadales bacterium]|jgi:ABC-type bacteriocin/lantibiotic exporter with double-glycine peptidase domain|nr:ATP-binding cassette domain-containing protein [Gemmatimonadales bacterium]
MSSQAWAVVEVVAKQLGVEVDPAVRAEAQRALAEGDDVLRGIVQGGQRLQLAFLQRSLSTADVRRIAETEAFPAILLGVAAEPHAALVLLRRRGGRIEAVRVQPDGSEEELEVEPSELVEHAQGIALRGLLPISAAAYLGTSPAGESLSPLQRTLQLLGREKREIALVYLYATLVGLLSLTLPLAVQSIIGLIQGGLFLQPVVWLIAFVILGSLASGALGIAQLHVVELVQQRIFARVAFEFGFKVPRLEFETTLNADLPETMNRFFEVITIQKSLGKLLTETTTALLSVSFGMILLTFYHPYFTLFGFFLLAALFLLFRYSGPRGLETSLAESKYKYRVVHWLEEMARAITAFKFSGASLLPMRRMDDLVTGYLKYRRKHFGILLAQAWSMIAFKVIVTGGLLVLGAVLVVNRQITLGQFVASEIVIVTVLSSVEKLILSISTVYDLLTSIEKLGYVSDLPVEQPRGLAPVARDGGMAVTLRGVDYRYPGAEQPSLRNVSLEIGAGQRVAVVGADGSGQSTLLRVMSGLFDDFEGTITFDGLTLRDLDQRELRGRIGQMLSLTDLFDGSIEENVTVGRPGLSTTDVLWALEQAGLAEHVQRMPLGLRSPVAAGGGSLSVSNAKKLLLAQAIVGRPRLLLLEDIVQYLEGDDREHVIRMLTDPAAGWTLVIVTHDPALLAACDRVVVLDDGAVCLDGSFQALLSDPRLQALVPLAQAA